MSPTGPGGRGADRALRAGGLLAAFNRAGVLTAADVHVATRLGVLGGEPDEQVRLATALAVRGVRHGSVVLRLADVRDSTETGDVTGSTAEAEPLPWPEPAGWLRRIAASPLLSSGAIRLEGDRLWLERYWRMEDDVASDLRRRAAQRPDVDEAGLREVLDDLWPPGPADDQRRAAEVCLRASVAVLGGGPGTGKTTTVARIVAALRRLSPDGRPPRVALAAPTGKAAARLQEAVHACAEAEPALLAGDRELLTGLTASTLHRLLGARRGSGSFWHHEGNRLPHDVVVLDEASMMPLTMLARLVRALRPQARLLLVGDPDQLASVEAGAVLADLVAAGGAGAGEVAILRHNHRFADGGHLPALAEAIRAGDADTVLDILRAGHADVRLLEVEDEQPLPAAALDDVRRQLLAAARPVVAAARGGDADAALAALDDHRLLCAHRQGPRGVTWWTPVVQRWMVEELGVEPGRYGRYPGLPLLVTANDYDSGLWNGDAGVVLRGEDGNPPLAAFARAGQAQRVPLGRISEVQPMHAMTVHRSQGSQFTAVSLVLPAAGSPLATRETLYTGVTRAIRRVTLLGSVPAVRAAVQRPAVRASGLAGRLRQA